jgi:hypothetical protein
MNTRHPIAPGLGLSTSSTTRLQSGFRELCAREKRPNKTVSRALGKGVETLPDSLRLSRKLIDPSWGRRLSRVTGSLMNRGF